VFRLSWSMPQYTEARIRELCQKAVAAKTSDEVERIFLELREALREHIHLAKTSLESQAKTMATLDHSAPNSDAA
jgi:hypothetical protein